MTTQGAAKIVRVMTTDGYVRTAPDPRDGRAKLLALDERGRRAVRTAKKLHAEYERVLRRTLGADGSAALRRGLELAATTGEVDPASRILRPN